MKRDDKEPRRKWFWFWREKKDEMRQWFYDMWDCGSDPMCTVGKARCRCQRARRHQPGLDSAQSFICVDYPRYKRYQ